MEEKNALTLVNEGDTYYKEKKYFLATTCYDAALELEPRNSSVWIKKGNALLESYQYDQALFCFDKSIELDPESESTKNERHYARKKISKIYRENLSSSGIYIFIGILVMLGAITTLIFLFVGMGSGPVFWGALINTIISIILGFVWIGLTRRFKLIAKYLDINKSNE
ncbi:MAG: tetratricopeptide repeat protein [Promethearchaeota archaeon]|nr:MAG: tetratricopeptide repeat protein [Candidatus Lokiarchaeota archaeon]